MVPAAYWKRGAPPLLLGQPLAVLVFFQLVVAFAFGCCRRSSPKLGDVIPSFVRDRGRGEHVEQILLQLFGEPQPRQDTVSGAK